MREFVSKKNCRFGYYGDVTKCFVDDCTYLFVNYIKKNFPELSFLLFVDDGFKLDPRLLMNRSFEGMARRDQRDSYNREVGENVAYLAAKKKVYASFTKRGIYFFSKLKATELAFTTDFMAYDSKRQLTYDFLQDKIDKALKN